MRIKINDDGWVLIDRNGKHFGTILNFLRDCYVPLPECRVETAEILAEAKYFLIQKLVQQCQKWLEVMTQENVEPDGICKVPLVNLKADCDRIPVIKLLINRHNNKYSYTVHSDDNLMKNLELFDRLVVRFSRRILFVKDIGSENTEVCQWTFFGQSKKKAEICCTSIVYTTDRKQTKIEFPEARIYEEAMNVLLFEERHVCIRCGGEGGNCTSSRSAGSLQLQLPQSTSHSASVSPQRTSPASFGSEVTPGTSGQDERCRFSKLMDGRSISLTAGGVNEDIN
ncbi:unnamed protein product [Thelazia callipaeda]|uniref:BTB_2 domain-containing protein n=1 Tax=Thelazia callipaeda TaxID=103827 RepID=A0A0N5CQI4_THECL|nr:unnamed protein product [Thelazia callipaeda]